MHGVASGLSPCQSARMARRFTRSGFPLRDSFAQSQALRARHGRFASKQDPEEELLQRTRRLMREAERDAATAGLPRICWHFNPREVAAVEYIDNGRVLFRLHDGRVFDDGGDPRDRNS